MNYPVTLLSSEGSVSSSNLAEIIRGKKVIIDFWHTRCVRCPMTLELMNEEAVEHPEILFIACAFSLGEGNEKEVIKRISAWNNLTHLYMDEDTKESLKEKFSIMSVPFALAINQQGEVVAEGDPKVTDFKALLAENETANANKNVIALAFDEDF